MDYRKLYKTFLFLFYISFSITSFAIHKNVLKINNSQSITMDTDDYQLIVDYVNQKGLNTHKYPSTSENYFGASAYYSNFDARLGSYHSSFNSADEAIAEAISTVFLPQKVTEASLNDTLSVYYKTYTGVTSESVKYFRCTSTSPLQFEVIATITPPTNSNTFRFGSDTTLDVVTWNIEHFPKDGNNTVELVKEWLVALDADIYGLQEIDDTVTFKQMVAGMNGYAIIVGENKYAPMCFVYKSDLLEVSSSYQLFTDDNTNFPRAPLVLEVKHNENDYILVNNHLKCCGDGQLDLNNNYDEENRRLSAMQKLKDYMDKSWSDKAVIVLGDFNDVLEDKAQNNVFQDFINDDSNYKFADMHISLSNQSNWSYPSWPSDLDHILITNELFSSPKAKTIKIDSLLTWSTYDTKISDHRPVGIQIPNTSQSTATKDISIQNKRLKISPNPVSDICTINYKVENPTSLNVKLFSLNGKQVPLNSNSVIANKNSIQLITNKLNPGLYIIQVTDGDHSSTARMIKK